MSQKPPSPAALRRRIEGLEAEIESLRETNRRMHEVYQDVLSGTVDYKTRAQQAARILQGADE